MTETMPLDSTPILVGAGQVTQKTDPDRARTGIALCEEAARGAAADTGAGEALFAALDTLAVVGFTIDEVPDVPRPNNAPLSVAKRLGISPRRRYYTATGGNTPQMLVNRFAEDIAEGRSQAVLVTGAEFLKSFMDLVHAGADVSDWVPQEDEPVAPDTILGDRRAGVNENERIHELQYPANTYPLIETAIRADKGRGIEAHLAAMGRLMAPLSEVAAGNPLAWFPTARTAEEIATPAPSNRWVGWPYTKYMNAVIRLDMAAALVMTSVGKAKELGIPRDRWVFLHGCGDAADIWHVTERPELHRSPAIRGCAERAFGMAGWRPEDLDFVDLYSCFPSALEIACREIGLAEDDPRGLTVTGGLPYFGGPGNNYVTHSIATMMERLRARPGTKGLCTANGWFVTKHAAGLYSTAPVEGHWRREDPKVLQGEIDAAQRTPVTARADGPLTVESYTVVHGRQDVRFALILGRLEDGTRCLAHVTDKATCERMKETDFVGAAGTVSAGTGDAPNIWTPS